MIDSALQQNGNFPKDFRIFLQEELKRRCGQNRAYSLRSFARSLKIHHAALSLIMRGKRPLTPTMQTKLGQALGLGPAEMQKFVNPKSGKDELAPAVPEMSAQELRQISVDIFTVISDWHHDAILELTRMEGFEGDHRWIAKVLGITMSEVNIAVERLQRLGFLKIDEQGKWQDLSGDNTNFVADNFTVVAFQKYQKQILALAMDAVQNVEKSQRCNSTMMMAINTKDLPEAQKRIRDFNASLMAYLQRSGVKADQVYQLAVAFFPITNTHREINHETH